MQVSRILLSLGVVFLFLGCDQKHSDHPPVAKMPAPSTPTDTPSSPVPDVSKYAPQDPNAVPTDREKYLKLIRSLKLPGLVRLEFELFGQDFADIFVGLRCQEQMRKINQEPSLKSTLILPDQFKTICDDEGDLRLIPGKYIELTDRNHGSLLDIASYFVNHDGQKQIMIGPSGTVKGYRSVLNQNDVSQTTYSEEIKQIQRGVLGDVIVSQVRTARNSVTTVEDVSGLYEYQRSTTATREREYLFKYVYRTEETKRLVYHFNPDLKLQVFERTMTAEKPNGDYMPSTREPSTGCTMKVLSGDQIVYEDTMNEGCF